MAIGLILGVCFLLLTFLVHAFSLDGGFISRTPALGGCGGGNVAGAFVNPGFPKHGRGSVTNCHGQSEQDLSFIELSRVSKKERLLLGKEEGEEGKGRKARHYIEKQT